MVTSVISLASICLLIMITWQFEFWLVMAVVLLLFLEIKLQLSVRCLDLCWVLLTELSHHHFIALCSCWNLNVRTFVQTTFWYIVSNYFLCKYLNFSVCYFVYVQSIFWDLVFGCHSIFWVKNFLLLWLVTRSVHKCGMGKVNIVCFHYPSTLNLSVTL